MTAQKKSPDSDTKKVSPTGHGFLGGFRGRIPRFEVPVWSLFSVATILAIPLLCSLALTFLTATEAGAGSWRFPGQRPETVIKLAQEPAAPRGLGWTRWRERAAMVGAQDEKEPITIDGRVRHPVMFFAHVANRRWSVVPLFSFLFFVSAMLKLFLPGVTNLATTRCRTNLYASLSSAFIYATVLVTIIRFSFFNNDLEPMGIFTFGLLQLSFALGTCLGTNLFAHNLYSLITRKGEPARLAPRVLIYGLCLTVVAVVMTLISVIPNLGQLPRVGNRMVMLVAALGLGGLVNHVASLQKPRAQAQDSSGPE